MQMSRVTMVTEDGLRKNGNVIARVAQKASSALSTSRNLLTKDFVGEDEALRCALAISAAAVHVCR